MSDLDKGTTYGDADGPIIHVVTLGQDVPTFLDPREDLIPVSARGKFKRLSYHVPFAMRGHFTPEEWPEEYAKHVDYSMDMAGFVLCSGTNREGAACSARAVNRTHFCRNHGGALHPCDKKMSGSNVQPLPAERAFMMDRVQQFMQGILTPADLADDEVKGQFVRNDQGIPISTGKLGMKFQAILNKELLVRMNNYIKSKAPRAIEVMYEVADSDVYEAADRIKAAQWLAERVIGKVPDVTLHGEINETPFSTILTHIDSGSRADYRKSIEAARHGEDSEVGRSENTYVDAEIVLEDSEYDDDMGEELDGDIRAGQGMRSESELRSDEGEDTEQGSDDSSGEDENSQTFDRIAKEREDRKLAVKEARERIKKAKGRRYAARATGSDSIAAVPILVQFKELKGEEGGYRMKLVPGSTASPATIDKLIG